MRKREKQILIRVSDEELEMINENAKKENLSRSDKKYVIYLFEILDDIKYNLNIK